MDRRLALSVLEKVCRVGLGAMFVYSAWTKIDDPGIFADAVMRYEILPEFAVGLFSLTLPMVELLSGLALVFTKWMREAAILVTGLFCMFVLALGWALALGLEIDCGCFGMSTEGGRGELVVAIVRDLVLLVPSIWLVLRPNSWLWQRR